MTNKTDTNQWRAEFDEQFPSCNGGDAIYSKYNDDGLSTGQYIKSFISDKIEEARKEGYTKGVNDTHDVLEPFKIAENNFRVGQEAERERIQQVIADAVVEVPEMESDEYDHGRRDMKVGLLAKLNIQ